MKNVLGLRIKELRKEKGLTQFYLASELGYKHSSIISEIEAGKKKLSAEKLPIIARVLGVEINALFFD
ncbi:helix-turn-helix transcriptional regulator [Bacillus licheniformis]|uniref:helix-turn-helix domain-containing protein n=1 Tax=Bacillus TaxID=1386 RepID=UPI002DBD39E4|nr:helix-turn-helix transcriptional regulator [Bacillus licheniformis]MEC0715401.1 helix-turn-helix transcriptional regulator [Bacillus licheniformis]